MDEDGELMELGPVPESCLAVSTVLRANLPRAAVSVEAKYERRLK